MSSPENDFLVNARAAVDVQSVKLSWILLLFVAALIGSILVWANFAQLEEVTTGTGRVIPSKHLQVIQHREGGIVRAINVRVGQPVQEGEILMQIEDVGASSKLGEFKLRRASLRAQAARLAYESKKTDTLSFPEDLGANSSSLISSEKEMLQTRTQQLENQVSILQTRAEQKKQELITMHARSDQAERQLELLIEEIKISTNLYNQGAVPRIELIRLQRQLADLEGRIEILGSSIPQQKLEIEEVEKQIASARSNYQAAAQERLNAVQNELAMVDETMLVAFDRVNRTAIRSPVNGIVNRLNITTIGGVIRPGAPVIEIVPVDDTLRIEANIRPQDIAFLHPGQPASIKITAYDFSIYGSLAGEVELITADTYSNDRGETYYRAIIRAESSHLERNGRRLPIIPGMIATVDVQTGQKSVLDYILKPITKVRYEAFRER